MTVLAAAQAAVADRITGPVRVRLSGTQIAEVTEGLPQEGDLDLGNHLLAPGFVDIHCHGGGGFSFSSTDPADLLPAVEYHRRHGTTSLMASLGSEPLGDLREAARRLADLASDGHVLGIHFEGPFLSPQQAGAHRPACLIDPTASAIEGLVTAADGHARVMTLAPELDGGLDAVAQLRDLGVVAALGHSDASYDVAAAAIERGVSLATHLWNGMRGIHHRAPGPIPAIVARPEVVCELIVDGEHLHPQILRQSFQLLGRRRVALITDAIAAAGMPDGEYHFADAPIVVRHGRAALADGSSLAGSTLDMATAVRNAIAAGVGLLEALTAASATPARLLGLSDRGVIEAGRRADLVVLDADQRVTAVMGGGAWIVPPTS